MDGQVAANSPAKRQLLPEGEGDPGSAAAQHREAPLGRVLEEGHAHQHAHVQGVADGLEAADGEDEAGLRRGGPAARNRAAGGRPRGGEAASRRRPPGGRCGSEPRGRWSAGTCRRGSRQPAAAARTRGGWRPRPPGPTRATSRRAGRSGWGCGRRPRPTAGARRSPRGRAAPRRGRGGRSGRRGLGATRGAGRGRTTTVPAVRYRPRQGVYRKRTCRRPPVRHIEKWSCRDPGWLVPAARDSVLVERDVNPRLAEGKKNQETLNQAP